MTSQKCLKICRLLVAVLLFNMVAPILQAAEAGQEGYTTEFETTKNNHTPSGDHCPYCKLVDSSIDLSCDHLRYPVPDANLALNYHNTLAPSSLQHILDYVQLRAPPIHI